VYPKLPFPFSFSVRKFDHKHVNLNDLCNARLSRVIGKASLTKSKEKLKVSMDPGERQSD
jgi:hypothetical protein